MYLLWLIHEAGRHEQNNKTATTDRVKAKEGEGEGASIIPNPFGVPSCLRDMSNMYD